MHWPAEDGTPVEEYWQVFTDLKRQGKIRAAGLSNHGIFQLEAAESIGNVDAIQPPFNLIHRDVADDVLLWARGRRLARHRRRYPRHRGRKPNPCHSTIDVRRVWGRNTSYDGIGGGVAVPSVVAVSPCGAERKPAS